MSGELLHMVVVVWGLLPFHLSVILLLIVPLHLWLWLLLWQSRLIYFHGAIFLAK